MPDHLSNCDCDLCRISLVPVTPAVGAGYWEGNKA